MAGVEVYGADPKLRSVLQERAIGYVLAVACDHQVTTLAGKHPARGLARRLPSRAWNRISEGAGAKGHRWYDWALIDISVDVADTEADGGHVLLIRRSISTGELAFYRCYAPTPVPLSTLVAWPDAGGLLRSLSKQVRDWPAG